MRSTHPVIAGALVLLAAACSPALNWREVNVEATQLKAVLPCKPDKDSREVPLVGRPATLQVLACDAGGAKFALLHADVGDASRAGEALWQWRLAALANLRGTSAKDSAFAPRGASALAQSAQVLVSGQRGDGTRVQSHAAYFARGTQVFQAVIYADRITPEMAEPFFSSLQFQ